MPDPGHTLRPRLRSVGYAAVLAVVLTLVVGAPAFANFKSTPTAPSMTVSSATLAPPTGVAAANINCQILSSTQVRVTWTATPSLFADGYEIFRSTTNGGPYTSRGTVSGRTTTTFTETVSFSTTYYYVVKAKKINWRSVNSNQASVSTPSGLCIL